MNQVGYSKLATSRFANFGAYLGDGGSLTFDPLPNYEVIHEQSGAVVTSGQAVYVKDDTALQGITSGEHVYRLRLDTVPEGGPYFVSIPGAGRSRSFGVGDEYSRQIAYVATRGLYHQRCGIALERPYTEFTRETCHTHVADTRTPWNDGHLKVPAGSAMQPMRGGYHDAGDYDRRPYHTIVPLLMLTYFEAFPTRFVDKQYNIPAILVYGPTEGRSGTPYQRAVSDKLFPEWDRLPAQRRYADGWSLVNCNEFTVWETIVWNVVMHGFLFDAGSAKAPVPPLN